MDDNAIDVPPLEDMEETLELNRRRHRNLMGNGKITAVYDNDCGYGNISSSINDNINGNGHTEVTMKESINSAPVASVSISKDVPKTNTLGGLKKGFFNTISSTNNNSTKKSHKNDAMKVNEKQRKTSKSNIEVITESASKTSVISTDESMPFIRKDASKYAADNMRFDEVQDAMKAATPLLQKGDWINESLLNRIASHPNLMSMMNDPRFTAAFEEMKKDPSAAIRKYPEFGEHFKQLCGILGSHFEELGDADQPKQQQRPVGDVVDPEVQKILNEPSTKSLLEDPEIQALFAQIKSDPNGVQRTLANGGPSLWGKVQHLIQAGLLQSLPV